MATLLVNNSALTNENVNVNQAEDSKQMLRKGKKIYFPLDPFAILIFIHQVNALKSNTF